MTINSSEAVKWFAEEMLLSPALIILPAAGERVSPTVGKCSFCFIAFVLVGGELTEKTNEF